MAQRTAFLNSDAKWYNKDFHHTWIHNYLLHQVWVMFTDYNTKNEFKLGNGQISGGKAIIRCTRTTGNFAGSKILALFESTATESISTSGDKKVFIEIPEIYVNDSTAITDTLTQGLNLWVGVIKSEADYPSHTNYIPLWEITGGDWEQAVDVRPEILARGKPNTISYIDNNGVQRNMMLDASSLNKFLKSNWAWVAPSWADVWDVVEVSNLKNTFFAWEDLLPKSMFRMESELDTVDAVDESIRFGYDTDSAKVQLNTILSGKEWDYVKLNLEGFNTPADNVNVRIETVDSSGNATGTLINPDATATINPSWTLEEMSINLAWMIDWTTAGQEVAVVLSRSGALSTSNYYKVWVATADTGIWKVKTFDWTSWNLETGKKWYISSPLFMEEWAIQSKATTEFLAETTGYVEAGATAGNEFTGVRFGMIEYDGFKPWDKVFLTDTGELSNISWAIQKQIGSWVKTDVVEISSTWIWWGWWVMTYDAVVAADGSWDYENIEEALADDKFKLFIKKGSYDITGNQYGELHISANSDIILQWENTEEVILNFNVYSYNWEQAFVCLKKKVWYTGSVNALVQNLTMNCHYSWDYAYMQAVENKNINFAKVCFCNIKWTTTKWLNFYPTSWNHIITESSYISNTDKNTELWVTIWLRFNTSSTSQTINCKAEVFATNKTLSHILDIRWWWVSVWNTLIINSYSNADTSSQVITQWTGLRDSYSVSWGKAKVRIYWTLYNCSISHSEAAVENSDLYTKLSSGIEQWYPWKSYTTGTYVIDPWIDWYLKCTSNHTSDWTNPDYSKWEKVAPSVDFAGRMIWGTISVWDYHNILLRWSSIYLPSTYLWGLSWGEINNAHVNIGKKCVFTLWWWLNIVDKVCINVSSWNYVLNVAWDYNKLINIMSYLQVNIGDYNKFETTASKINVKWNCNIVKHNMFFWKDYIPVLTDTWYTWNIVSDNILKKDIYWYND